MFDLIELNGTDSRREPGQTRRATLGSLLHKARDGIRLCEHDGEAVVSPRLPHGPGGDRRQAAGSVVSVGALH
jgi:hypothetical protein